MSTQKNYLGKGKKINSKYGEMLNLSFKLEDLQKIVNERGYVNVTVTQMKEADKYGNTHTVYENDYKPQGQSQAVNANEDVSDLPF